MATAVRPEKILKDLAKLWVDLGKEDSQKGSAGVLRACAMTLIAAVEEEADAAAVGETLAELMHQHPSRAIVLRVCPDRESAPDGGGSGLDARVFAQCWMPFGRRQQICCEQIEITASPSRVDDLPKLVLGLMVPDLPVVLWCRCEPLRNLFPLANKIIVDTELKTGIADIRQLLNQGYNVADLAWTRLTRWRDSIAQIFDNEKAQRHLGSINAITITHSGPEALEPLPSRLAYLAAWFKRTLPSPFNLVFKAVAGDSNRKIQGIQLIGPDFTASVRLEGAAAVVMVNELTRRIPFPKLTDYELLREELGILGIDPVFRRCLE